MKNKPTPLIPILLILPFFSLTSMAQPGTLDQGFGNNGTVTTGFTGAFVEIWDIASQSDDQLIVLGRESDGPFLVRYSADGDLDPSFGDEGVLFMDYISRSSVRIQPDDKVLVFGYRSFDYVLTRYTADGHLDLGFGDEGVVEPDFRIKDVVLQEDQKVLVAGIEEDMLLLTRFLEDGSVDAEFGSNGLVSIDLGFDVSPWKDWYLAVQPDGKIVVAGSFENVDNDDFGLIRLLSNGNLDLSFGGAGVAVVDLSMGEDEVNDLIIQPDGRIVVVGSASTEIGFSTYAFAVVRFNPNGTLDESFGMDGIQITDFPGNRSAALAVNLQADGKIMVLGESVHTDLGYITCRYTTNGILDSTYSENGRQITNFGPLYHRPIHVFIQSDGKIIAGGGFGLALALVRYQADGSMDSTFHVDGIELTTIFHKPYSECFNAISVHPNGQIIGLGRKNVTEWAFITYDPNGNSAQINEELFSIVDFADLSDAEEGCSRPWTDGKTIIIQPDGKILMGLNCSESCNPDGWGRTYSRIDRIFPDGTVDTTLDGGYSIVLQEDGKIVTTGRVAGFYADHAYLYRYHIDGSPDSLFNATGRIDLENVWNPITNIQPDGNIIVAGERTVDGIDGIVFLRFTDAGVIDSSFHNSGEFFTDLLGSSVNALLVQPDGKMLFSGDVIARLNPNGGFDGSFGLDGIASPGFFSSIALQEDGKILAAGTYEKDFALLRYLEDGSPDTTFGDNGLVITDFDGHTDRAYGITIQPDGKIIVAGSSKGDFALARYLTELHTGVLEFSRLEPSVLVYPNPVSQRATLAYTLQQEETLSIYLADMQGRLLKAYVQNERQAPGEWTQNLEFPADLLPGSYRIILGTKKGMVSVQIILK